MIIEDYLKQFHTLLPGCTSDALFTTYTDAGKTSYELLSDLVPLESSESMQVLDIACGDGFLLQLLHLRRQHGLKIFGIDMTPAELNKAKERLGSGDIQHVDLRIGRVQHLPYPDNTMDYVLCHMAFMLMNDIEDVIAEVRRVLKPGGTFAVIVPGRPHTDAASRIFRTLIREAMASEGLENSFVHLGDPLTKNATGLQELFEKCKLTAIKIKHYATKGKVQVANMVWNYSTYYGPDLLSKSRNEKFKSDMTEAFEELENSTGQLYYESNFFQVVAKKSN